MEVLRLDTIVNGHCNRGVACVGIAPLAVFFILWEIVWSLNLLVYWAIFTGNIIVGVVLGQSGLENFLKRLVIVPCVGHFKGSDVSFMFRILVPIGIA